MITAVDSCVILDVLCDDPTFGDRSMSALRRAREEGRLVVCDMVVAEVTPVIGERIVELMSDWGLDFVACDLTSTVLAGLGFGRYLERGGKRGRIVADFLIGAHALENADRLLTRDQGFDRDYFRNLEIWYPERD